VGVVEFRLQGLIIDCWITAWGWPALIALIVCQSRLVLTVLRRGTVPFAWVGASAALCLVVLIGVWIDSSLADYGEWSPAWGAWWWWFFVLTWPAIIGFAVPQLIL